MADRVWIGALMGKFEYSDKPGLRKRYRGGEWSPAQHIIPPASAALLESQSRYREGFPLAREEFPEALAVWDRKRFNKLHDIFPAGPFYAVKLKLANVLKMFDLGEGGLLPIIIYQEDCRTPEYGDYFILKLGSVKDSLVVECSKNLKKVYTDQSTGTTTWKPRGYDHQDGDVALSPAALQGPDLWVEQRIYNKVFFSDKLAQALMEAGLDVDFALRPCTVLEGE